MARTARYNKSRSVFESLKTDRGYRSDQSEVWNDVAQLHENLGTASATGAMRDAYSSRQNYLLSWLEAFPAQPGEVGLVFLLDGKPLGVEFVARPEAYQQVHERLIKSYTIDLDPQRAPQESPIPPQTVDDFLSSLRGLEDMQFPACGHGTDHRFETPQICGSVLIHEGTCIHGAFFQEDGEGNANPRLRPIRQGPFNMGPRDE
jgi:hypothetical protein